jgi:hypothetical protein
VRWRGREEGREGKEGGGKKRKKEGKEEQEAMLYVNHGELEQLERL